MTRTAAEPRTCAAAAWIRDFLAAGGGLAFRVIWAEQCAAVLPCYNEARQVAGVVAGVRTHVMRVIVVDDGSTDATGDTAAAAGAEVIRHPTNRGKGAALRTGLGRARQLGYQWALTLDGDGQHAPADVPLFFAVAERNGADLIIGNRLGVAHQMPWLRRQVNRWMTSRLSKLTGRPLADSQCGFRLIRLSAWVQVEWLTDRFETESEQLVQFLARGCRVEFVPVQVIYHAGGSKIQPWADTWRWLRWRWRARRR